MTEGKDSHGGSKDTIKIGVATNYMTFLCISSMLPARSISLAQAVVAGSVRRTLVSQRSNTTWSSPEIRRAREYTAASGKQKISGCVQDCAMPCYQAHWEWETCSPAPAISQSPGLKDSSHNWCSINCTALIRASQHRD